MIIFFIITVVLSGGLGVLIGSRSVAEKEKYLLRENQKKLEKALNEIKELRELKQETPSKVTLVGLKGVIKDLEEKNKELKERLAKQNDILFD